MIKCNRNLVMLLLAVSIGMASGGELGSAYFNSGILSVNYDTEGGTLWLGASLRDEDGEITDLAPRRVSGSGTWMWTVGIPGFMPGDYEEARVSLWEDYDRDRDLMVKRIDDTLWFELATGWQRD